MAKSNNRILNWSNSDMRKNTVNQTATSGSTPKARQVNRGALLGTKRIAIALFKDITDITCANVQGSAIEVHVTTSRYHRFSELYQALTANSTASLVVR
jgi:membrane-bound lytic murein transglycosylase